MQTGFFFPFHSGRNFQSVSAEGGGKRLFPLAEQSFWFVFEKLFGRSHFWLWVIFHSLKDQQSPTRWVSSEHEGRNRTGYRRHRGHERPGAGQGQARPLFSISVPSSAPESLSMPAKREGTCSSPLPGTPAAAMWGPAARLLLTRPAPPRVLTAAWGP